MTENESSIQVIDIQVNKSEDEISFAIALDLNRFPRLTKDGTCVIKMRKKTGFTQWKNVGVIYCDKMGMEWL